jgi:endonuclease/exonuclease/phosphatase (EEP) superfamily protein YafD
MELFRSTPRFWLPALGAAVCRRAGVLAIACLAGLCTPLLARLLGLEATAVIWLVDLASHWQWLYGAGLAVCTVLAGWADRRWWVLSLALPLPWLLASAAAPPHAGPPTLTLVSANVHLDNPSSAPLASWLAQVQPDVVVLQEVTPSYAHALASFSTYPFRKLAPQDGPFGLALLSRYPVTEVRVTQDEAGVQTLTASLTLAGRQISLVLLHPMPPISAAFRAARDQQLMAQAHAARAHGLPTIVAGDLNTTPWSAVMTQGIAARLKRTTSLAPTWPRLGAGLMGIPIDQVLVSPHWGVIGHDVGPDIGSDHLPVIVRLGLGIHP